MEQRCRVGAFAVGTLLGYKIFLAKQKKFLIKTNKEDQPFSWKLKYLRAANFIWLARLSIYEEGIFLDRSAQPGSDPMKEICNQNVIKGLGPRFRRSSVA